MSIASLRTPGPLRAALDLPLWRSLGRGLSLSVGGVLMAIGLVGALLPWHLGAPVLVLGLIIVLRSSYAARRRFIDLQQRHPNVVFPIRRLLRREPEVLPVAWQQILRFERLVMPRTWRVSASVRRRLFRRTR
jgi:hypothetical protein